MRTAAAATALGLTLLAAAGLAACSPDDPVIPPDPLPSVTPVFASDEEALAAAEKLYGEYQAAADALGASGWKDPTVLNAFVRGDVLRDELASAESFREKGYVQIGQATFDSFVLQQIDDRGPGTVFITAYLCVDVSAVDVVNSEGESITSPDRPDRQPLEIDIDDVEGGLRISRSEAWAGQDFC
jgi:hypothetical protein